MEGTTSSALLAYLEKHQGSAVWLVATTSANSGASIELATGRPVLAMGGFSGSDPAMTVSKLRQLVSSGQLRYVLVSGGPPGGGGARFGGIRGASNTGNSSASVTAWVTQNCAPVDYSGTGSAVSSGLYDCSTASSAAGAAGA